MDVKNQTETVQYELPQIRRIRTLHEVKRIEPSRVLPPPIKEKPRLPKVSIKLILIGLVFFSILGLELAIIYRYDKLNKRLYQISVSLKDRLTQTTRELTQSDRVKSHIAKSRNNLLHAYHNQNSLYSKLQFKQNNYKTILAAKTSLLGVIQGDLRVAVAHVEALKTQQEVLVTQIKEKSERISQLTAQLLDNIGEQELLVNKNLKLRKDYDRLTRELANIKTKGSRIPAEE